MFFPLGRDEIRWIQKTLSRARRAGSWNAVFDREACWTPGILAALVDEHDRLSLEGQTDRAAEVARRLPELARRIRASSCPGLERGRRSLEVWALAVAGSSLRAQSRVAEAGLDFAAALDLAKPGVFAWAKSELARRYGFHLLHLGDRRALLAADQAAKLADQYPDALAAAHNLLGICRGTLEGDSSGAIVEFGRAAALSDPARSLRSGWTYHSALHNLSFELVKSGGASIEALGQARKLLLVSRDCLPAGIDARKAASFWAEGLLVYRIGWDRHGERLLEKARQGFWKLGRLEEYALATVDLALLLADNGESERAGRLMQSLAEEYPLTSLKPRLDPEQVRQTRSDLAELLLRSAPGERRRLPGT